MTDPDDLGDLADRILTFLHVCEEANPHWRSVSLARMDGAIPLQAQMLSERAGGFWVAPVIGDPRVWPVDVRFAVDASPDSWPAGSLQFHRLRTCSTAEARQMGATQYGRRFATHEVATGMPDGTALSESAICCLLGARWVNASPHVAPRFGAHVARHIPVALGMAEAIRLHWTVWLGFGDGPRVRFVTDPTGAREVFRLRDIPPGRQRRAALLHWVTAHSRRIGRPRAGSEADRAWVRRHLRGATDFQWNDLRCRIEPAEAEVEQMAASA